MHSYTIQQQLLELKPRNNDDRLCQVAKDPCLRGHDAVSFGKWCPNISGGGTQCLNFQGSTGPWHLSWTYSAMNIKILQSCQIIQTTHLTKHHIQKLNPQKQCSKKLKISYSVSFLVSIFGVHKPLFFNFSFINLYHPKLGDFIIPITF